MASGLIVDYLGFGLLSERPVSLTLHTGALGLFWATDEGVLYVWDGAWDTAVPPTLAEEISYQVACSDLTTAIETGTTKGYFRSPKPFLLQEVRASLLTASTSGTVTVDINVNGVTILTTKLTIDQDEKTSVTAATPAVIDAALDWIDDDDEVTFDIDGAGTGAAGLIVTLIGIPQDAS